MSEAAQEEQRKLPTLLPDFIGLAEFKRQDWVAQVGMNVIPEDLLDPAFWAHVCGQFKPLDTIEVRWEDGSLIHHFRVLWCDKTYANVKLTGTEKLGAIVPEKDLASDTHMVEWKGVLSYCVIRKSDRQIVQSHLDF